MYSNATFLAAKLALLPLAYGAAACSAMGEAVKEARAGDGRPLAYSRGKYALLLPFEYSVDWWKTAYWLARSLGLGGKAGALVSEGVEGVHQGDEPVGLGVKGLWSAPGEASGPTTAASEVSSPLGSALFSLAGGALRLAAATARKLAATPVERP